MALNKGAIYVFVTLLILGYTTGESLSVLEEGAPCTASAPCSKHSGLNCQYGFCRCPITKSYEDGECKIQAGQRCERSGNTESGSCLRNSDCSIYESKCTCKTGYIANLNGTCSTEKNYGDVCSFDEECVTKNKTFHCINGICQCDVAVSQYRASRRNRWGKNQGDGCIGLARKPCLYELCIENGVCSGSSSSSNEMTCECSHNYKTTKENTCVGVAGANCPCAEGFICVGKTCRCALSNSQYYDEVGKTCSSYVGSPCNDKNLRCIDTAKCVKKSGNMGICECPEGSVETQGGSCELSYGSLCNNITATGDGTQCDVLANLYCRNGTCSCIEGSIYEKNERRCAMPVGFRCSESSRAERVLFENESSLKVYCVANAECVKPHPMLSGRCQCKQGFVMSSLSSCEKKSK